MFLHTENRDPCVYPSLPLYFPLETSGQIQEVGVQGERGGGYNQLIASMDPRVETGKETKYI